MTSERIFRARTVPEAMRAVKEALGPEAVIVDVSRSKNGAAVTASAPASASPSRASGGAERLLSERLHRRGVPRRAAEILVQRMRRETGRLPRSLNKAAASLSVVLGEELLFAGPITSARAVALVGPTGVGKTTTVAKLAAHVALVERRSVGLISLDDYRIGGAEQLQRYADLIGVPMESGGPGDLRRCLKRLGRCDLVLVDTAGRAPADQYAIDELASVLASTPVERVGAEDTPVETHLCIPASAQDVQVRAIIERHACLAPSRLLSTKVDEAVYHGGMVAAQTLAGLPFSYFTTGQRVPEDIEIASANRLAEWLCGEEVGA